MWSKISLFSAVRQHFFNYNSNNQNFADWKKKFAKVWCLKQIKKDTSVPTTSDQSQPPKKTSKKCSPKTKKVSQNWKHELKSSMHWKKHEIQRFKRVENSSKTPKMWRKTEKVTERGEMWKKKKSTQKKRCDLTSQFWRCINRFQRICFRHTLFQCRIWMLHFQTKHPCWVKIRHPKSPFQNFLRP